MKDHITTTAEDFPIPQSLEDSEVFYGQRDIRIDGSM